MGVLPLELRGVGLEIRGRHLLGPLSLRFEAGPLSVIVGPNGAGKSLLLRVVHGLVAPTAGSVHWLGEDAAEAPRRQAMVFQHSVLLRRSAAANVDYALRVRGVPRGERRQRVERALATAGVADHARRPARLLSIGQQQRLALARAWALEPEVLLLDEPTASLDPASTGAIEDVIRQIRAAGVKVVMTTHDLGQARRLADEVLLLHAGALVERGETRAFFGSPATEEARRFIKGELLT